MSSRIHSSRYSRRRQSPAMDAAKKVAADPTPIAVPAPATLPPPSAGEDVNLRFGFVEVHGQLAAIEVQEEIWGNKRYHVAALCEDPSICIKALSLREAVGTLVRHLRRSPTIRRYYFDQSASRPRWVDRVGPASFS